MQKEIKIGDQVVSNLRKPFIVAEMSGNHNQSLDRAIKIVEAAATAGVDAIKLQTYTADTITMLGAHQIIHDNPLWHGKDLYDLYKEAFTPWEWHEAIIKRAEALGLICFSSPFDETAVDYLENLKTPAYKIASFENTHHPLLAKVARTGKPVIMSTGVSTPADIYESVQVLRSNGCDELVLLKCTSTYPSTPENSNLLTIPHMKDLYNCSIGLSDHSMGIGVAVASVALGAVLIEKHFTLSRAEGGVDASFSMEPEEMKSLVIESERAWQALGKIQYEVQKDEEDSMFYKRSIYISSDIRKGEVFTRENIKVMRPGNGLSPKYFEKIIGRESNCELKRGMPLMWDSILK